MQNTRRWILIMCSIVIWSSPACAEMTLKYARSFEIDYFDTYKVVTVLTPWPEAQKPFRYILVQRDHPSPTGYEGIPRIEIPIRRLITTSTTHIPYLDVLNEINSLVAISNVKYVHSPTVNKRHQDGQIVEVGHGAAIDLEKTLTLEVDLVMTLALGEAQYDAHPVLQQADVPAVINADYTEPSVLGRAEWIKFIGAFYNKEGLATALFDTIVAQYQTYTALTRDLPADNCPTVFSGTLWRGTWFMSGGKTYIAQLIKDAGGTYLWSDNDSRQTLPLDFEVVYARAHNADHWLPMRNDWIAKENVLQTDTRYGNFQAFKTGQISNVNARLIEHGGNDYFEMGLIEPHLILADMIKIFHPTLLPKHQLKYHQKLR